MTQNNLRKSVDGFACLDDYSHAKLCADRLLSESNDNTVTRALWQSALISIRRALANSQSVYTKEGGGVAKPFDRNTAKQHLPDRLHAAFDELLTLADKCIAHRQPKVGVRTVEIEIDAVSGDKKLTGKHMLPTIEQRQALREISNSLKDAALSITAGAFRDV